MQGKCLYELSPLFIHSKFVPGLLIIYSQVSSLPKSACKAVTCDQITQVVINTSQLMDISH